MATKKRTRDSYESEANPVNTVQPSRIIKNIKQDTETISERTINILMNSQKNNNNNNNNKVNSSTVKDVEFTNLHPNIPSDYFSCSDCTQGSCRSCCNNRQLRECPSCYHKMCGHCAHYCEGCNDIVCSNCCVTNNSNSIPNSQKCDCCCEHSFDQTYDIDFCIDCNYNSHK
ncbi:hypothetical protein DICPUDRAFT_90092 [Dictyostelium purpureum]|uniref:TNFR-Cys domain-containing protein n=1 Tax=Dictyostelium purpureum TaxID=5786 RepID=F1A0B9_DICPU|nr:uncharacterized protein DICPUDRAFT_90092 [Dictyostelium purpureum]EGC30362.1 hypothetical protein DICPUDRAFT_90092 [Dictyostelium purpureum]|eukprot:XP_003293104.1 hypothetical protein DICPUDRAFT_90092 [Dictyostelium purpureum]